MSSNLGEIVQVIGRHTFNYVNTLIVRTDYVSHLVQIIGGSSVFSNTAEMLEAVIV